MESYEEIVARTMKPIVVQAQADDGTWYDHHFSNEGAAIEYENKWQRRGVPTRRVSTDGK